MPNTNAVDETRVVPEYEFEQYFPNREELSAEERALLREQHGHIRTFYRTRPDRFRALQRWLNQARFGLTYDVYLETWTRYALGATVLGLVLGVLLTVQLAGMGAFEFVGTLGLPEPVGSPVYSLRVAIAGSLLTGTLAGVLGGGLAIGSYYYPRFVVGTRRRSIDVLLPHAIVYMYALSYGGMNTFEVVREIAEADEVYGAVSEEFDMIVRDVELFGNDLFTALRDARNLTPSDNLEQFLDDLLSVLDSGSDVTGFLEGESETYMQNARQEQEDFLETLSIMSEVFVVAFVAAPLFLIVTLIVISLLGSDSLGLLYLLVYLFLPTGMVLFLLTVDVLSNPYAQHAATLDVGDEEANEVTPAVEADPQFERYHERKRRDELRDLVSDPIERIRERSPYLSLVLTLPAATFAVAFLVASGLVTASAAALVSNPVPTTIGLFVVPFLVVTGPLTLFYEGERRRKRRLERRFPDTLNVLSSANQMGIRLAESFGLVSRWSEGVMATELEKVQNDITWNHDVEAALLKFANRLEVPQVTRTMKLVAKGSQSSGDLSRVISIAAEDTRNRAQIEQNRRSTMSAYIAIVVIGFLVYLAVVLLINGSYLEPIGQFTNGAAGQGADAGLTSVTEVPVAEFRMVFFHSALVQAVGSGLLAGKLAENDALAGLKYSLLLVGVAIGVFTFL
jgi:flagellar protein FlaJ